jgi:hypothetical protein
MKEAALSPTGVEEKSIGEPQTQDVSGNDTKSDDTHRHGIARVWSKISSLLGVEEQGNDPIPIEQKNDRRYWKLFTLWFSMNFNLIS